MQEVANFRIDNFHVKELTMSIRSHSQAQKISETSQTSPARGLFQHPKPQPEVVNEQERPKIPIIQDGKFNGDFSQVPVHNTPRIQPKLKLGQPGDRFEQEADRVARQVVRGSHPMAAINRSPSPRGHSYLQERLQRLELGQEIKQVHPTAIAPYSIQALCSDCDEKVQRQEMMEEDETEEILQAKTADGEIGTVDPNIEDKITTSRGKGQPLLESTRDFMEPRFGADFSGVKVHTDGQADGLNRSLHARAFTTGQDIFFRQGEYNPGSQQGKELLAHELTHVVQQKQENIQRKIQRQSIHNPLYQQCHETDLMPGGMSFFGTLVHLAIQQHYVSNIDPLAGTEYTIPGSSETGRTGRADIVSSSGGIYEIKPHSLVRQAFTEAENYVLHAEQNCDPNVNWHLGTFYYPPRTPIVINGEQVNSWLYAPGVIAYNRRQRRRVPQQRTVPQTVPRSTLDKIREFARRVIESGVDAEQAAEEFLQNNPEIVWAVLILGSIGIIILLADDFTLAGFADNVLIPVIATLMRVAWRFAY